MGVAVKPSVGRIVHYVQYDGNRCQAAIITAVETDAEVSLYVFAPDAPHSQGECTYSDGNEHGTWHWPERVDG